MSLVKGILSINGLHSFRAATVIVIVIVVVVVEHKTRKHSEQVNVMWAFNPNRHTESVDICIFVCFICILRPILMASQTNEYNNTLARSD